MRKLVIFAILFFALVLENSLFNYLKIAGVKPDLLLLVVIFHALLNGPREGFFTGLAAGLLQDLRVGEMLGLFAISKAFTGYLFGLAGRKIYRENLIVAFFCVVIGTFIHGSFVYLLTRAIPLPLSFWPLLTQKMLPEALYNGTLVFFTYYRYYHSNYKGLLRKDY